MSPDESDRWQADVGCRDTVVRVARLADLQQYEAFCEFFTEDAELQRPNGETLRGREAILAAYRARPAAGLTRHLVASTVVDLLGTGEASALSSVLLWSGSLGDPSGPFGRPAQGPAVVGEFDDLLKRGTDGRWRIARRHARFVLHIAARG